MTRHLAFTCLALATLAASGCHLFSKSPPKPKENQALTEDVEESLHRRWLDKRVAELVAQGQPADAARTQADAEFRERYGYTHAAQK